MFCVSCGKEVNSSIPICKECALKVLLEEQEKEKTSPVLKSIEDYAVEFSPMEEQKESSAYVPQASVKHEIMGGDVVAIVLIIVLIIMIIVGLST